jgi:hypothetical protein
MQKQSGVQTLVGAAFQNKVDRFGIENKNPFLSAVTVTTHILPQPKCFKSTLFPRTDLTIEGGRGSFLETKWKENLVIPYFSTHNIPA